MSDKTTYTKDELLKFKVDAIQAAKEESMTYEMSRSWHPIGGKLTPRFKIDIYGGDPKIVEEIALRVQKMMIEIQERSGSSS